MKIQYNEMGRDRKGATRTAEIMDIVPVASENPNISGDIVSVHQTMIDTEQGNDDVYSYDFYEVRTLFNDLSEKEEEEYLDEFMENYTEVSVIAVLKED